MAIPSSIPPNQFAFFEYYKNFGRMGSLSGLFVSTPEFVRSICGKLACFGEVLGKHSYIDTVVMEDDFFAPGSDEFTEEEVLKFAQIMSGMDEGDRWCTISGYNPIDYIIEWEKEEDINDSTD